MKVACLSWLVLSYSWLSSAQSIPHSELVSRLNANAARYSFFDHGPNLLTQAEIEQGDVSRTFSASISEGICAECPEPNDVDHWRVKQAVAESDLVAIGTVSSQMSALTKGRGFVFTDSEFVVDDVWASQANARVHSGTEVTITTAGGSVTVGPHQISATLDTTQSLQINHRYLLFLKYIPETKSYEPVSLFGFDVTSPTVIPIQRKQNPPASQYLNNLTNFLKAMHSSTDMVRKEGQ